MFIASHMYVCLRVDNINFLNQARLRRLDMNDSQRRYFITMGLFRSEIRRKLPF